MQTYMFIVNLILLVFAQTNKATDISCGSTADDSQFSGSNTVEVSCPPGCLNTTFNVWGTQVYTADSSICKAAIHAGVLTNRGGAVIFHHQPGQNSYSGSLHNSILTLDWVTPWSASFSFEATKSITCGSQADDSQLSDSNTVEVSCPSGCLNTAFNVWGTQVYTADSSICRAAIHAGVLTNTGGIATFHHQPGQSSYGGTFNNLIQTRDWRRPWSASFSFEEIVPDVCAIMADSSAYEARHEFTVECPPGCASKKSLKVWGKDYYTDDSSICRAAIHANIITDDGGTVTVFKQPAQHAYEGLVRNNITSSIYGPWSGSFTFVKNECLNRANFYPVQSLTIGNTFSLECPHNCLSFPYQVWGSSIYTDDSSICAAAIHKGVIDALLGGRVEIIIRPGQVEYAGSIKHHIVSYHYGNWPRSFTFSRK